MGLVVVLSLAGCATPPVNNVAQTQAPQPEIRPAAERVQAVAIETTAGDEQTTWIIDPDVQRIPKIAGLDAQLPPHIERRLSYAYDLAQRGATYSANAEFRSVLGLCALEVDARNAGISRREALREGLIALEEADEFGGDQIDWRDSADVRRVAASHQTQVLSQNGQAPVDSIQAVQAYYAFAEERLAFACEGLPAASLAFYGLGRTFVVPGTQTANAAGKAALLQRVALKVAPQNVLAGNELGVLLAQHGQLNDAEKQFRQCVATNATPETWRNLSVVYARQGKTEESRAALAAGESLAANSPRTAAKPSGPEADDVAPSPSEPSELKQKSGFLTRFSVLPEFPKLFRR
jgi:tetratricopeptide (TPR) repeat protein